ncbi:MAG: type IV pilus assembly protein PilM [Cyanobacteria bacterium J06642_2]
MVGAIKSLFQRGGGSLLGVELSPEEIAVAQVKQQGSGIKLEQYATIAMPEGAMEEGRILDPDLVGMTLTELLEDRKIKPGPVASAIPGREVIVRLLKLSADLSDGDLRQVVLQQEAELYIPFDRDAADIDYQILGVEADEDGTPQREVLLVATPKEVVDNYLEALRAANLQPRCIEPASFSILRSIQSQLPLSRQEAVAVVAINYESTEINIVVAGVPQFTRTIAMGTLQMQDVLGQALNTPASSTGPLLQSLKLPIVRADDSAMGEIQSGSSSAAGTAVARVLTELAEEIQRSIDFYANQENSATVSQILLAGSGTIVRQIDLFFSQQLNLTVQLANPLSGVTLPASVEVPEERQAAVGVAIGLGMREF